MQSILIVIPGCPVAKGRPKLTTVLGHARSYTPEKTRNFEAEIKWISRQEMAGRVPMKCALGARINVFLTVPASWSGKKQRAALSGAVVPSKRPDIDNYLKSVFDGMNQVVYADDALVCDLSMTKRYSDSPRVMVEIYELDGAAA